MNSPISLKKLAEFANGEVLGDPGHTVSGVCSLTRPARGCLAFAKDIDSVDTALIGSSNAAVLVPRSGQKISFPAIAVDNPRHAFACIATTFFAPKRSAGIAQSAKVANTAHIGKDVTVGEYCVIGPNCVIGDGTELRHHVVLGESVTLGRDCLVKSHAVLGEEGFGFEKNSDGSYLRIPHFGSVIVGNSVEIGATTVICRGTIDATVIGERAKIDDHVFIAHNCEIGDDVVIIACAEISGSVTIGAGAWIGPNVSILNGLNVADETLIGMGAVVTKSTEIGGVYAGSPARLLRFKEPKRPL